MVGTFAGVGALVEDVKGVVKIEPIDKWVFFEKDKHLEPECHINDYRLLERLKDEKGFPRLKALVKVPTNTTKSFSNAQYAQPTDWENVATAQYFPKWMFCSSDKCRHFKPLGDWWQKWDEVIKQYDSGNSNKAKEYFIPPKCGYCYEEAKIKKKGRWYRELTQVRFIMTSSDGKIRDVPWNKWITFEKQANNDTDKAEAEVLSTWKPCCDKPDLYYKPGDHEGLAGIYISCKKCSKWKTLAGIYGLSFPTSTENEHRFKTVIRSSNSVYYPLLVHSLYLPSPSNISDTDQSKINGWKNKGKNIEFMYDALEECYSKDVIQNYIDTKDSEGFQKELVYRRKEYQFIINETNYEHADFIFTHQDVNFLDKFGITSLVKVSRLKMTTVQTGYTRQQPLDVDLFLSETIENIKPKYTSDAAKNTKYLLGIENFGEGIFIAFNKNNVDPYISGHKQKLESVFSKSQDSALFKSRFSDLRHLANFIFIHTFSHLLMKELEFSCGYPTVSLQERLFVDENEMQGVLIYTVGGMEGSYGGLASQATPVKFKQLLKNALERAEDCASDPICKNSEGQGVAEMNLAACYSCALVAENACEVFNSFLDRNAIPD